MNIMKSIRHPHLIHLYHSFETNKYYCLIMDYCEGGDLKKYIEEKGYFDKINNVKYLRE